MNARIELYALGLPAPKGSKRHVGNGVLIESSKRVKPWQRAVAAACRDTYRGDPLTGPVGLTVEFYLPRPVAHMGTGRNAGQVKASAPIWHITMPDLDKTLRSTGDALTGLAYRDDRQIVAIHAHKHYSDATHPVGARILIDSLERP